MILFGLGNPGKKYLLTRHNFGFMFLDFLAITHAMKFKTYPDYARAKGIVMNKEVMLCKPLLFMNNSGAVVKMILNKKYSQSDFEEGSFLVVSDDLNLPLGRMKLYKRGTDGGHLGLRSIIECLDTISFLTIRLGIGPAPVTDWSEYVLSPFTKTELPVVRQVLERGLQGVHLLLSEGLATAQTFLNTRKPPL